MNSSAYIICKELSANDIGLTGSHQAGILIPKNEEILNFFPTLNSSEKNPRKELSFVDATSQSPWSFNFIYYNNKHFDGTRNEYRLTKMTKYIRSKNASPGDFIFMSKGESGEITIDLRSVDLKRSYNTPIREIAGWQILLGI